MANLKAEQAKSIVNSIENEKTIMRNKIHSVDRFHQKYLMKALVKTTGKRIMEIEGYVLFAAHVNRPTGLTRNREKTIKQLLFVRLLHDCTAAQILVQENRSPRKKVAE